ncbi:MAG: WYL domain-containing protein [Clostridia bacterium]|jgi:predicted DNA-binding transcriptional regulator YafY|nr:WYL domain-containing protein [Clostridia bacterium]MBR2644784.1 WYL domain-containing protein [Clostridia bacterium]MBR3037840.1 WYL domain-containing protein [Clostridia bacterium]MBR3130855.1 WYL domain-containing protein [Clostridia bacterium]
MKHENQKFKILLIRDWLNETDELHPLTVADLLVRLEREGIRAERKSVTDDLLTLSEYGMDIESVSVGKKKGYYLASRAFEPAELKMLVDSVQAARFLSAKKTNRLIKKLAALSSRGEGALLRRQLYVNERNKSDNESIFYNIDAIHGAIAEDREITFLYWQYDLNKKRVPRKDGARYRISPFALIWDDEFYYLIGYDPEDARIKHYRVDKMNAIRVSEAARRGKEAFAALDMTQYTSRNFSMFAGEEEDVVLDCDRDMIGVIVDRFGSGVSLHATETGFSAFVRVAVSEQFFGWVSALGGAVRIASPATVRERFLKHLDRVKSAQEKTGP